MDCPFKPAGTWLVVQMEQSREKIGSLYVPDTAKDAPQVGTVIAVGPGTWVGAREVSDAGFYEKCQTEVGNKILFQKYAGAEIDWTDNKTYLFVKESDVVAYVK